LAQRKKRWHCTTVLLTFIYSTFVHLLATWRGILETSILYQPKQAHFNDSEEKRASVTGVLLLPTYVLQQTKLPQNYHQITDLIM